MRAYPLLLVACAASCAAAAARRLDTECAYLLLSESTAWKDDNDQSNFAIRFKAPQWPQYQQVVITFSRPVSVNEIYNAAMVSGATGGTELIVQLADESLCVEEFEEEAGLVDGGGAGESGQDAADESDARFPTPRTGSRQSRTCGADAAAAALDVNSVSNDFRLFPGLLIFNAF